MQTEIVTSHAPMTPAEIASVSDTPGKLIALAIANGTPVEALSKLMDLQERWESARARKEYVAAMSDFKKAAPPAIVKKSKVDFTSQRGRTHYNYANLGDVVEQITPLLAKHGLHASWETQTPEGKPVTVTCHITHSGGHRESTSLSGPADLSGNKNAIQAIGSCVTYLQRYTLLAALGLATMEDDDGRGGEEKPAESKQGNGHQDQPPSTAPPVDKWAQALEARDTVTGLQSLFDEAIRKNKPEAFLQAIREKLAAVQRELPADPPVDTEALFRSIEAAHDGATLCQIRESARGNSQAMSAANSRMRTLALAGVEKADSDDRIMALLITACADEAFSHDPHKAKLLCAAAAKATSEETLAKIESMKDGWTNETAKVEVSRACANRLEALSNEEGPQ